MFLDRHTFNRLHRREKTLIDSGFQEWETPPAGGTNRKKRANLALLARRESPVCPSASVVENMETTARYGRSNVAAAETDVGVGRESGVRDESRLVIVRVDRGG